MGSFASVLRSFGWTIAPVHIRHRPFGCSYIQSVRQKVQHIDDRRLVHGSPLSLKMLDAHREIHNNATPFMVVPFVSLVVAIHPFIAPFDIYIHHDFYDNGLES